MTNDSDGFFSRAENSESRPRAVNPRTGQEQSWQRASNYAAPLDNPHGLIKWKNRELVKGLSLRPDLARMLLTGAAIEDNEKADQIITQAHAAVALDAKANEGTAVHAVLSRSFLGHETPAEYERHVSGFAGELRRNGLKPRVTEVTLFNTQLGSIGHVDWIVETADGRFLVLDVKTGKLDSGKRKFAVQCKVYAGADFMVGPDIADSKTPVPIPYAIDQNEAILAHVDPITGATALYRVDLRLGFYGAVLAEQVRNWEKIEVLAPYVPALTQSGKPVVYGQPVGNAVAVPLQQTPKSDNSEVRVALTPQRVENRGAVDQAAFGPFVSSTTPDAPGSFPTAPTASPSDVTGNPCTDADGVALRPSTEAERIDYEESRMRAIESAQSSPIVPQDELLKPVDWLGRLGLTYSIPADPEGNWARPMTMAEFQSRYPVPEAATAFDVALVDQDRAAMAAATASQIVDQQGTGALSATVEQQKAELMKLDKAGLQGIMKGLGGTDLAHNREWLACWIIAKRLGETDGFCVQYAKSKGTLPLGTSVTPENPVPTNVQPGFPGDLSFMLKAIAGAKSEGAILALRDNLTNRRGDQAWTDEMAEAARRRVTELIAAEGNAVDPVRRTLAKISQATEQAQIAQIWSDVTIAGSVEENWTEEMHTAANDRMAEIQRSLPAVPTPFGPTS